MITTKETAIPTKDIYRFRLTPLINRLLATDEVYRSEFNHKELLEYLVREMEYHNPEEFLAIRDHDLTRRVERLMALELVYGLLDDFSSEEIQLFDEAVAGR